MLTVENGFQLVVDFEILHRFGQVLQLLDMGSELEVGEESNEGSKFW